MITQGQYFRSNVPALVAMFVFFGLMMLSIPEPASKHAADNPCPCCKNRAETCPCSITGECNCANCGDCKAGAP